MDFKETGMEKYLVGQILTEMKRDPEGEDTAFLLFSSGEIDKGLSIPELGESLRHMPAVRDAHVCKAEARRDCLCGTVVTPRFTQQGKRIAFSYLVKENRLAICDDSGAVRSLVRRLIREKCRMDKSIGRVFYEILEQLVGKDLHHLEELEDQMVQMEDMALKGVLDNFNARLMARYKEVIGWMKYYIQLDDMVCELEGNETGLFGSEEETLFHIYEKKIGRLLNESQLLREHCIQVRELFQAEIDIRQNIIMKILTIVTTVFLPLTLLTGWYGMNFTGMRELSWKYGYEAVIGAGILIVCLSIWIMKKKKFW